jgi:hypothetical protein
MAQTEDELKRTADLKLWLESKIAEYQEDIDKLKDALAMVDSLLRASSFKPAIEVSQIAERREIRRDKGGELIAHASITPGKLIVELIENINLRVDTPPLKSFLLGKILQGMKNKDDELVAKGRLKKGEEIKFRVDEKNGRIESIIMENYRERERLSELLNTIAWTFSRMLEK